MNKLKGFAPIGMLENWNNGVGGRENGCRISETCNYKVNDD